MTVSATLTPQPLAATAAPTAEAMEVRLYSHSPLFYWWPVWVGGFLMALATWMQGTHVQVPNGPEITVHPNRSLGITFCIVFLLVLVMTHAAVRGVASLTVIVAMLALTFLFAWMGVWDDILLTVGNLVIFMNLGFYLFFSSGIFLAWAISFFITDRMSYWKVRPGQLVHYTVFGGGEQSYDTGGMSVTKMRDDLFRHWVLGLGSGDVQIATSGAKRAEFVVSNVLFVGAKLDRIQQLVATKPDDSTKNVVTVGDPV
jgi:hypothetical protein